MRDVRALFYADRRAFANDMRRALRSPGRLVLWTMYACALGFFVVSRALSGPARTSYDVASDVSRADFLICAQLLALALALAFGAGRLGFFRTLAEARFVVGSRVPPPVAIAYLQARASLASALRWLSSLFYLGIVLAPRHLGAIAAIVDVFILGTLFAAATTIALARRLARPPWPTICTVAGVALALAAAVPAVRDIADAFPIAPALRARVDHALPALHPGTILLTPSVVSILAPLALAVLGVAVVAYGGRDAYPELYALSVLRIDKVASGVERLGRTRTRDATKPPVRVSLPAPAGPPVFVWKSMIGFRRTHANTALTIVGSCGWVAAGFAIARGSAAFGPMMLSALATFGSVALVTLGILATGTLASEVRQSLFWLSNASLVARVAALVIANDWRKIVTLGFVAIGLAAGGAAASDVLVCCIALPALVVLVDSIGFAVYAFVPNAVATGGPVVLLRLIVMFALIVPIAVAATAGALLGIPADVAVVTCLAIAESAALVAVTAWRIDGGVDRFVT